MVDGVFPALLVAGLFLLVAAVIVGTVVIVRRGRSQRPRGRSAAAVADDLPISTGPAAETESATGTREPAISAQTEREAGDLRRQADAVMAAAHSARAEAADEARQHIDEARRLAPRLVPPDAR